MLLQMQVYALKIKSSLLQVIAPSSELVFDFQLTIVKQGKTKSPQNQI